MVNRKGLALSKVEGFTLIEAMISIGVISIVIPVIFSLLFISLRAEMKIKALKAVKNNGDFALTYISDTIRENAFKAVNCSSPATQVNNGEVVNSPTACFRTKNNQCFRILVENHILKLKNLSGCGDDFLTTATEVSLTNSNDVTIYNNNTEDTPDAVSITTNVPLAGQPNARFNTSSVAISFKVKSNKDPSTYLNYYSKVKIRDY